MDLGITVDCADAPRLARFWKRALDYDDAPPPDGFASWPAFHTAFDVPPDEWDDGATLRGRTPDAPSITFLRVPEPKTAKNRLHLDLKVSGGRALDARVREERIRAKVADLVDAGGTVVEEHRVATGLDHVVMQDPEGNEFCVV